MHPNNKTNYDTVMELTKLVNVSKVEEILHAKIDDVERLNKGYLNTKFLLRSGNRTLVLKIYSNDLAFVSPKMKAEFRAQAEYQALQICQSNNLDAPPAVGLFGNVVLIGYLDGRDVKDVPLTRDLLSLVVSWLIRFHRIEAAKEFLDRAVVNLPLLAARKHIKRYISNNPDDFLAKEVQRFLVDMPHTFPDSLVLSRGDPTLGNWVLKGQRIYGVDFEFFGVVNPLFDIGLLVASVLDHGKFDDAAYGLCQHALRQYLQHNSSISLMDIKLGTLCGLILIAVSVSSSERRHSIFTYTPRTLTWIDNWSKGD